MVGFGIMVTSLVIPIVHYVAVPLSPFIAGFIGGGIAKIDGNGIVKFVIGVDEILTIPIMLGVWVTIALIPYTWFGATVGALGGYVIRRN